MLTTNDLIIAVQHLPYPHYGEVYNGAKIITTADFTAARVHYNGQVSELEKQWKEWLELTYSSGFPQQVKEVIFTEVWNKSHSYGYGDMENTYEDYAWFANIVRNAL